ncbi:hypothetical protein JCM10213_004375 [Rhodosporidiobolus nylandii]
MPTPDPTLYTATAGQAKHHFTLDVRFPVYAIAWVDDERVLLAGGGGGSRSGVGNRVSLYRLSPTARTLTLLHSLALSPTEDAPMTIAIRPLSSPSPTSPRSPSSAAASSSRDASAAVPQSQPQSEGFSLVAGINSPAPDLARGVNENLRMWEWRRVSVTEGEEERWEVEEKGRRGTMRTLSGGGADGEGEGDEYQKVTAFTRPSSSSSAAAAPPLLAIGSTNAQLSLLSWPEVEEVWPPVFYHSAGSGAGGKAGEKGGEGGQKKEEEEVVDVDFDDEGKLLVGTSPLSLRIYPCSPSTSTPGAVRYLTRGPEPVQVIERPKLREGVRCGFRAAKFGRLSTSHNLYTIVNTHPVPPSSLSQKQRKAFERKTPKKAFVSLWDADSWRLVKTRTVSNRPVTGFEVSEDGRRLAVGGSDLSLGVLDAETLRPITTILQAHAFPATCLRFNPAGTVLISGSADNSVRIVLVPSGSPSSSSTTASSTATYAALLLTLLVLVLAVAVQTGYVSAEVLEAWMGAAR